MSDVSLLSRVIPGLFQDLQAIQRNNLDPWRQSPGTVGRWTRRLRDAAWRTAGHAGLIRPGFSAADASARLQFLLGAQADLERFYERLGDARSRSLLVELLRLSVLGSRHVKLSVNDERYWRLREEAIRSRRATNVRTVGQWSLDEYEMSAGWSGVRLHAQAAHVLNTFLLEQYAYAHGRAPIRASAGQVVLDLGAGWGDTALYFATLVGSAGRVYCLECTPDNLAVLDANLQMNPTCAPVVEVVPRAAWHVSGQQLAFQFDGPASREAAARSASTVTTISVDDLVRERGLSRVDFIKMDIEGAEANALQGAQETIRRFKPTLAIAAYHRQDDFVRLPRLIEQTGVPYDLYLDHFTIFDEETVIFARSSPGALQESVT